MNRKDDDNSIELDTMEFPASIEPEKVDSEENSGINRFIIKEVQSDSSNAVDIEAIESVGLVEKGNRKKIMLYSFFLALFILSVVFFTVGRAFLQHRALKYSAGLSYRLSQNITAASLRLDHALLEVYRHSKDHSNQYVPLQKAVMQIDLSVNILAGYEKSVDNFLMYMNKNSIKFKDKNWKVFFELAAFYKSDTQRNYINSVDAYLGSFRKMIVYHMENEDAIRLNLKPQSVNHYNLYMKYRQHFSILRINYKRHLDTMKSLTGREPKLLSLISYNELPSWFWLESTLGGLK